MSEIKDGVYVNVAGTVGRVAEGRFNIDVMLSEKNRYPDAVTVWSPSFPVGQGDRVSVDGWLSWRKQEKDGKTYVNVSLNQPKLKKHEPVAAPTAVAQDAWAAPSAPSEMPF